jgi:hypothetical protein
MKKNYLLLTLSLAMSIFIVNDAFTNSGGAPGGNSSGPNGNNNSCARSGCHNGPNASTQTVSISTNIPMAGFKADSIYQITVQADNGGAGTDEIGFSASVESAGGFEGTVTISDAVNTKKTSSYITHTSAGRNGSAGINTWVFDWNAGQAVDQSTVYVAVNFSDNTGSTGGDVIVTETLSLTKAGGNIGQLELKAVKLSIYPNPVKDQFILGANTSLTAPFKLTGLNGKFVMDLGEGESLSNDHYRFDISDLAKGNYILSDSQGFSAQLHKD